MITALTIFFFLAVVIALWRELAREESKLAESVSGVVEVDPALFAAGEVDIVKTDRMVLLLLKPQTNRPAAMQFINTLRPPQTFVIGQENAQGGLVLEGDYWLVGITDKDGEIFKVSPGEAYGRSPRPISLGAEQVRLVLNQPFKGGIFNELKEPERMKKLTEQGKGEEAQEK